MRRRLVTFRHELATAQKERKKEKGRKRKEKKRKKRCSVLLTVVLTNTVKGLHPGDSMFVVG